MIEQVQVQMVSLVAWLLPLLACQLLQTSTQSSYAGRPRRCWKTKNNPLGGAPPGGFHVSGRADSKPQGAKLPRALQAGLDSKLAAGQSVWK